MDPPAAAPLETLLGALLCAAVGSVFAAADAGMTSLNPARLAALEAESQGGHRIALARYLADPVREQARWLVGRVVFTSLSAVLVALVAQAFVPDWAIAPVGALGALVTYGSFAEIATTLARWRPDLFATHALHLMRPLELVVMPFAEPLALLGRLTRRLLGPEPAIDARLAETEVQWAVSEGQKSGSLEEEPAEMIRNVLELKDLVARDVMIPRTRVSAVELASPLTEVLRVVATEGHSRYPVFRDSVDNIVGLLYAKDLFRVLQEGALQRTRLLDIIRGPVNFVPESQSVSGVLHEMRTRRLHMAVVIDEFGGVGGIVTLEDILEEIVGDIQDEYDTEEAPIQDLGDGRLLADAAVSVHDLSAYLGSSIPEQDDYESLGGMLTMQAGRVPLVGSQLDLHGLSFIVRDADEKRIAKVEIVRRAGNTVPAPSRPGGDSEQPTAAPEEGSKPASLLP